MTAARRFSNLKAGLLIAIVMICACAWLSPYWSIAGLARSAALGNSYEFGEYIDAVSLRENIKGQLTAHVASDLSARKTSGFEALGNAFGLMLIDRMVDQFVNPAALSAFLKKSIDASAIEQLPSRPALTLFLVQRAKLSWASLDIAYLGDLDRGRFVFRRSLLSWKLVAIELPPNQIGS